jgi:phosphatidylinositol alpha-mannosyltransferase
VIHSDAAALKIALASPYDLAVSGGVTTHVGHLAAQFRERGHEVTVIGPASGEPCIEPGIEVVTIGRPRAIRTNGSIARIPISPFIGRRVKALLARETFDVVHVHEPLLPFLSTSFVWYSTAVTVGTFHTTKDRGNPWYACSRPLLRPLFRRLDGRIAVSETAMQSVARYFPARYEIIPNGVDVRRFTGHQPLPRFMDGRRNLLFVGRPEERKGLDYLLDAFATVQRTRPDTRLIVVGDGPRRPRYEQEARQAGIEHVVFAGHVSDDELPRYYATADLCCFPSTGDESQGCVLLEAMASGKAVIASDIDGYRTVITDADEGRLVPPRDAAALAGAILDLLGDPARREAMERRGRARAQAYGWDRVAARVLDYYQALLLARVRAA